MRRQRRYRCMVHSQSGLRHASTEIHLDRPSQILKKLLRTDRELGPEGGLVMVAARDTRTQGMVRVSYDRDRMVVTVRHGAHPETDGDYPELGELPTLAALAETAANVLGATYARAWFEHTSPEDIADTRQRFWNEYHDGYHSLLEPVGRALRKRDRDAAGVMEAMAVSMRAAAPDGVSVETVGPNVDVETGVIEAMVSASTPDELAGAVKPAIRWEYTLYEAEAAA